MAKASLAKRVKWWVEYRWEKFPWFNKPKRAPKGSKYKKVVLAKQWDEIKKVSYWARWYSDFKKHKDPERKKSFHARHKCSSKKNKLTAGYWACKDLW